MNSVRPLPVADGEIGLKVLKGLVRERSLLVALELMHRHVGDLFQITMPGFRPAVFVGPETNRHVMVRARDQFRWRCETDPVTRLLRHGLLVEDGASHDRLRQSMEPSLQRSQVLTQLDEMAHHTDRVLMRWPVAGRLDMLVEMRKVALLILVGSLFGADFWPEMRSLWRPILKTLKFISPGLWIAWPDIPRPGYEKALRRMDEYFYRLINARRTGRENADDLVGKLLMSPGMDDDLIRDQLLTMFIAGHDTSTALLAWVLFLLGQHPDSMAQAQAEVDAVLGQEVPSAEHLSRLRYLDMVIKEALRLYPPIHVANRVVAETTAVQGYRIEQDSRVMCSIYLSHRHPRHWPEPERFMPERFDRHSHHKQPPLTYVPFGGGPRNCIGAAFAQLEAKVVLGRVLQQYELALVPKQVIRPYMGATLEPRPGVLMQVRRRRCVA